MDPAPRLSGLGRRSAWLAALALLLLTPTVRAEDEEPPAPREVAVRIRAEIDERDAAALGRYVVHLEFRPIVDIHRPYRIELRLAYQGGTVRSVDHSPKIPTTSWRKDVAIKYEVTIPVPLEADIDPGEPLDVVVGFFDPQLNRTVRPSVGEPIFAGRLIVARVAMPNLGPLTEEERIVGLLERARVLAEEGRKPDAWRALEVGIRRAVEDPVKYRFRDAILAMGHFEPRPLSMIEDQIVAQRIDQEFRRHLRKMSGRYYDRGHLFAALRLLERVGGKLSEEANSAVIGALAEAQRAEKDIQEIQLRILAKVSDADKQAAREAITKYGLTRDLLDLAHEWFMKGHFGRARFLLRELRLVSDRDLASEAFDFLAEVDRAMLSATPEDEQRLVEEAMSHPAFGRLDTVASHNFIYIGPKTLVDGIPTNSRLRYDVAFVFQTDLFGRLPNPAGDRITVFFKELWDFGGGQASGKRIDIGRAKPEATRTRVDTGLLYHELIHCVDDTNPLYAGFREGLANMGAAYTFEALGQRGDELHAFASNLKAFREDYLARDLEYWRIQSYGPSAGFFLHFVDTYAQTSYGHTWKPYRQFFREYRNAPVRDGREPTIVRSIAHYLVRAFGPKAFDDLMAFRFPLIESDREAIHAEIETYREGDHRVRRSAEKFAPFPNSPLNRDLRARDMLGYRMGGSHDRAKSFGQEELGIIHDWWVIGPFKSPGADPRCVVFPPEREVDFAKSYVSGMNNCKWRKAGDTGVVTIDTLGWVSFNFSYMSNTATYALTHVHVDQATDAVIHMRADDDLALFVNDRLVEGYVNRGSAGGDALWWRGPRARIADAQRFPVRLTAGRNKVLLKVKNRTGTAGFVLAVARPDGRPIPGLSVDLDPPAVKQVPAEPPLDVTWKNVLKHSFRKKSFGSKLDVVVGAFKVVSKLLQGQATSKRVAWRKYTVRPGFPKDSPSNLFWLAEKYTKDLDGFRLTLDLAPKGGGVPKIVVNFQGEGGNDVLSGWSLIVHATGRGKDQKVAARLERYDRLVYQTEPVKPPGGEIQPLVLTYVNDRLTVTLGEVALFSRIGITPIRVPDRTRIGVATYGTSPGISAIRLDKAKE